LREHAAAFLFEPAFFAKAIKPSEVSQRRSVNSSAAENPHPALITQSSVEEAVASGTQLLQSGQYAAAVALLEEFENSSNVLALSILGRSLLKIAEERNESDGQNESDAHVDLGMQLKQSIRKLIRSNATGKSVGCKSSAVTTESAQCMLSRGLVCLQKAVELGRDAASQTALANHNVALFQRGDAKDIGQALSLYESAGLSGNADAWYNLGVLYYNGVGVAVDKQRSMEFIRKAADLGDPCAHFFLFSQSDESSASAKAHLDAAAAAGHSEALYYKAMTLQSDPAEFISALVKAAEQGSVSAAAALGSLHYNGESGAVLSPSLAVKWWAIAASAGHPGASHNLGVLYERGFPEIGMKQDFSMYDLLKRQLLSLF
jgi:TPR repeat protein